MTFAPVSLILAPMATLSHEALRRTVERFGGCDEYYTEMIHAASLINGGKFEPYYVRTGPVPGKIVWQLTGGKTGPLEKAAYILAGRGGIGIDINMGCCAPEIYRQGAGVAWMMKPLTETASMLERVRRAMADGYAAHGAANGGQPPRLSAKIRLGDEWFTEKTLAAFADMLVSEGVSRITLHPRTRKEKVRGIPRWEYVEMLASRCGPSVSIAGNGGIHDTASVSAALRKAPSVRCIMIGRAAVSSPWIFSVLKRFFAPPEKACPSSFSVDLLDEGLRFLDDLAECQPPEFFPTRSRRFFHYYCENFTFAEYLRVRTANAAGTDGLRAVFRQYFEEVPRDRFLTVELPANPACENS